MAVYEYYCPKCKKEFEMLKPMSRADEPGSCPRCGGEGQKLVSVFGSTAGYSVKIPEKPAFRKRTRGLPSRE